MSVFELKHTNEMLILCTPYSYKLDENRKRKGYKDQLSTLLPFYQYIDNHYKFDWEYDFKSGGNEGNDSLNKYTESHILVSSKGSIIHIFASNQIDKNPFDKDTSLSMYPFSLFNNSYFINLTSEDIDKILTNKISNSSYCNACIFVSKFEENNHDIKLDDSIANILRYAPYGNISQEFLETVFNMFETYLSKIQENYVKI